MGWTYYQATYYKNNKIDRLAECRAEFGKQPSWATILKDSMVDNVYYAAMKSTDSNEVWALVVLTATDGREFGYKDMDETMGPGYYDCPIGILKLLSPTDNAYAKEWRKNVKDRNLPACWTRQKQSALRSPIPFKGNIISRGKRSSFRDIPMVAGWTGQNGLRSTKSP